MGAKLKLVLLLWGSVWLASGNKTATWLTKRDQLIGSVYGSGDGVLPNRSVPDETLTYATDPKIRGLVWNISNGLFHITSTVFYAPGMLTLCRPYADPMLTLRRPCADPVPTLCRPDADPPLHGVLCSSVGRPSTEEQVRVPLPPRPFGLRVPATTQCRCPPSQADGVDGVPARVQQLYAEPG